jgi:hypothetical protein
MRKKGGQRLMEMARRSSKPVVEEVTTVKRYTDSDRFKPRLAEMPDEFDADQSVPAPPAPGRDDLIGGMFPRLTAAADLLGKIRDNVQDKYTKAELQKLDDDVLSGTLDNVMVKQLTDIESLLSGGNLEKNLAPVRTRIDKQNLRNDVIAQKDLNAVDEALRAKETDIRKKVISERPETKEEMDERLERDLMAAQTPIEAFTNERELQALVRQLGLEMPNEEEVSLLEDMADTYKKFAGVDRSVLQLWVAIHKPEMDEAFNTYLAENFGDAEATEE